MDRKESTKGPLEAAVTNLEKAEADLRLARVDDATVERKLANAEQQIEELAEELARDSKIKVNGRTRTVEGREVSFQEVVKLAFPNGPTKPNTKFTVTFTVPERSPHCSRVRLYRSSAWRYGRLYSRQSRQDAGAGNPTLRR